MLLNYFSDVCVLREQTVYQIKGALSNIFLHCLMTDKWIDKTHFNLLVESFRIISQIVWVSDSTIWSDRYH